jgi:uncharacterized protein
MMAELRRESERLMRSSGHDYQHVLRVYNLAKRIGEEEKADVFVLEAAALLHDLGRAEEARDPTIDHAQRSAEMAREILERMGFQEEKIEAILYAIRVHRYREGIVPETKEAKILQDADKLDALGAVGIMRCFSFGGAHGRGEYDPADPLCKKKKTLEEDKYSVDHFYQKLFKLKDTLHTSTAKRMAEGREKIMRLFLEELEKEISGYR